MFFFDASHAVGDKMKIESALEELRKNEKRKFSQAVDAIINLKGLDLRRDNINIVLTLPHKFKEKKVCSFLNSKSSIITTITKADFPKYKDKKAVKNLVKKYDFFIASAPLMPLVASTFGKVLGPTGKMPSPQLGIISAETDDAIKKELEKISSSLKIRIKELSIKSAIGKESMPNEQIIDNFNAFFNAVINALPKKKDNVRKVMLKFTMTKPVKLGEY